jgi:regulator of protease activity HflC (stomatin/prohibitin superfamily)
MTALPSRQTTEGWRRGKPEEDPEKMKRWGWVSAKPSEFLICMRGGKVVLSGQGATTFKWPWESVSIVPTTVQRLHFVADQVTAEKAGVQVTGVAVYRIADPLIAFRMLNFSYPERAQEKLSAMMGEMFIGATRRLVANLSVEHCMTRRKDALAAELMREIAPVVGGTGRTEDRAARGWGVVVDSIEIQDVRVMSAAVFANMQARFRQELERQAREAELARDRAVKQDETATERQIELARVAASTEVRREKQAAEESARLEKLASDTRVEETRLATERAARQAQLDSERELQLRKVEAEAQVLLQKQALAERAKLQQLAADAKAEAAKHALRVAAEAQAAEVLAAQAKVAEGKRTLAELELKTVELETKKQELAHKLELDRAARLREIDNTLSPEVIQMTLANRLPELAAAFQQKMGEVHITAVDGANPFGYVAAAVEGVMGLARSAGLELPKKQ